MNSIKIACTTFIVLFLISCTKEDDTVSYSSPSTSLQPTIYGEWYGTSLEVKIITKKKDGSSQTYRTEPKNILVNFEFETDNILSTQSQWILKFENNEIAQIINTTPYKQNEEASFYIDTNETKLEMEQPILQLFKDSTPPEHQQIHVIKNTVKTLHLNIQQVETNEMGVHQISYRLELSR